MIPTVWPGHCVAPKSFCECVVSAASVVDKNLLAETSRKTRQKCIPIHHPRAPCHQTSVPFIGSKASERRLGSSFARSRPIAQMQRHQYR